MRALTSRSCALSDVTSASVVGRGQTPEQAAPLGAGVLEAAARGGVLRGDVLRLLAALAHVGEPRELREDGVQPGGRHPQQELAAATAVDGADRRADHEAAVGIGGLRRSGRATVSISPGRATSVIEAERSTCRAWRRSEAGDPPPGGGTGCDGAIVVAGSCSSSLRERRRRRRSPRSGRTRRSVRARPRCRTRRRCRPRRRRRRRSAARRARRRPAAARPRSRGPARSSDATARRPEHGAAAGRNPAAARRSRSAVNDMVGSGPLLAQGDGERADLRQLGIDRAPGERRVDGIQLALDLGGKGVSRHRWPPGAWSWHGAAGSRRWKRRRRGRRRSRRCPGRRGTSAPRPRGRGRAAWPGRRAGRARLNAASSASSGAGAAGSAGSASSEAWRLRRRSSSRAALRAMPNSQARCDALRAS